MLIASMITKRIVKVEMIYYVYEGKEDRSNGWLQVTTDDGTTILLCPGGDGQSLQISWEPWVDPFTEPLSEVNRQFVRKSGKWSVFDVSSCKEFQDMIGKEIRSIRTVADHSDVMSGLEIVANGHKLRYLVEFDEGVVSLDASY